MEGNMVMARDSIDDVSLRLKRQENIMTDVRLVMETKASND